MRVARNRHFFPAGQCYRPGKRIMIQSMSPEHADCQLKSRIIFGFWIIDTRAQPWTGEVLALIVMAIREDSTDARSFLWQKYEMKSDFNLPWRVVSCADGELGTACRIHPGGLPLPVAQTCFGMIAELTSAER
ncbi:hypothetical protein [Chelatococcus asaccharovorans]|uniref:hypothetical protein n=1 Tax=Chelatococcus asaccharovorans TaxID=28210 RepID=UPI0011B3FAB5|nr:hypothetical protein [Chelatococcus asaccharovorans]MBS7703642.1 hypothetical protein [Chelatococcus asaccharovorans]